MIRTFQGRNHITIASVSKQARGPFLSFADFTNRRIIGNEKPIIGEFLTEWPEENRTLF